MLIAEDPIPTTAEVQRGLTIRPVWQNATMLAGKLRIRAAIPALVKWLTFSTSPGLGLGTGEEALVDSPAGMALANIGDPSISSLRPLLFRRDPNERYHAPYLLLRYHAAYVLLYIDSPKAERVLRDYVARGQDRRLADLIGNRLEVLAAHKSSH